MKLIIAVNKLGFIGLNDDLPWGRKCPDDLKHFKKMTMGSKCLVGRKTFEKLPPLKGRELIVVGTGYHTLEEALAMKPDFVIGGKRLYESVAHLCNEFHISEIEDDTIGDTLFPMIDMIHGEVFKYQFPILNNSI
jgi:dihydrofolate reductase